MFVPCHSYLSQDKEWQVKQNSNLSAFGTELIIVEAVRGTYILEFFN